MTPTDVSPYELRRLAERVRRLTPDHRDPERFFIERSEVADMLRRLAREMERAA